MAATMSGENVCRLCVNVCHAHKSLYDDKEVYEITVKYFDPMFLNLKNLTVLCFECWCHIVDFHNFQQTVELAQSKFSDQSVMLPNKPTGPYNNVSSTNHTSKFNEPYCHQNICIKEEPQFMDDGPDNPDDELILPELLFEINELDAMAPEYPIGVPSVINEISKYKIPSDYRKPIGIATPMTLVKIPPSMDKSTKENMYPSTDKVGGLKTKSPNLTSKQPNKSKTALVTNVLTKQNNSPNNKDLPDKSPKNNSQQTANPTLSQDSTGDNQKRKSVPELDDIIAKIKPKLRCEVCSKMFPTFTFLQNHFRHDHSKEQFHVLCCGRKFKLRSRLDDHLASWHKELPLFDCQACGKSFKLKSALTSHIRHCVQYQKKLQAKKIKSLFESKVVQVKKSNSPTFESSKSVQVKKEISSPETKPVQIQKSKPKAPAQVKKTSSTFECIQCGISLASEKALRVHIRHLHTVRNYKCNLCEKSYTKDFSLREHMAIHTGAPLHSCAHCPMTFIYRSSFRKHMQKEHSAPRSQPRKDKVPQKLLTSKKKSKKQKLRK